MRARFIKQIRDDEGFTLLELVVAMGLLALMAVLMTSALRFGAQGFVSAQSHIEEVEEIFTVRSFLSAQLENAYPVLMAQRRTRVQSPFDGRNDNLTFVAPLPAPWSGGGLHWISFFEETRGRARSLNMTWIPFEDEEANPRLTSRASQAVLLDNIRDFKVEYLQVDERTGARRWRAAWLEQEDLPELIRVTLKFEDKAKFWEPLVIEPMISTDATCVFDPISRNCRPVTGG